MKHIIILLFITVLNGCALLQPVLSDVERASKACGHTGLLAYEYITFDAKTRVVCNTNRGLSQ